VPVISSTPACREGDFIETKEGLFFDVKGFVHPPNRTIAFLRYFPSPSGNRLRKGRKYGKVYHLAERFDILQKKYSHYLYNDTVFGRELQGVPDQFVKQVYRPAEALAHLFSSAELEPLQQDVVTFAQLVQNEAHLKTDALGISGSILVDLYGPTSDIDLIVYGRKEGRDVQLALRRAHLNPEQGIAGYRLDTYRPVYNLRWSASGIPIETMIQVDGPKAMHGIFGGHHYFVRAVLDWNEVQRKYGDRTYKRIGYARASCKITKHTDSLFTPCQYEIDDVNPLKGNSCDNAIEIVSFRGRFSEQAKQDEKVIVQGTIEEVRTQNERWTRFLLGDNPQDILLPSRLI
jgi:predicted nucleotidyltransferase